MNDMADSNRKKFEKINNVSLVILAIVALTGALIYTKTILVPFVISFFIFAIISPVFEYFRMKLKLPGFVALLVTATMAILIIAAMVFFLVSSFDQFFQSADVYRDKIIQFIQWGGSLGQSYGLKVDDALLKEELRNLPILHWVKNLTGGIVNLVGNTFLILIFTLFMLLGEGASKLDNPIVLEVHNKISRYSGTKMLTSVSTGLLVGLILWVCHVDLALMFLILTILLNFIPSFGSIIATALPLPIVLLQYGLGWQFAVVILGCSLIQIVIGNVIEPKMMGESMDLHPLAIMLFLMFWGLVWGVPGMFLAVPITAILKIILSRIETTKPIAEILAGRLPER